LHRNDSIAGMVLPAVCDTAIRDVVLVVPHEPLVVVGGAKRRGAVPPAGYGGEGPNRRESSHLPRRRP